MAIIPWRRGHAGRARQRGVATILAVVLLVTGVLFILAQSMGIIGTRTSDTTQQMDSTAALMLAESGLQRAQAIVGMAAAADTLAAADCNAIAIAPVTLGRGTFSYDTVTALPANCVSGACNSCTVVVTGTVNSTSRSLSRKFDFGVVNGTTGRGTIVRMVLRNPGAQNSMALFAMAWKRQSQGGQASSTSVNSCSAGAGCILQWSLESSNGNPSVGAIGTAVPIAAGTLSDVVTQVISQDRDYVEVGALFPGVSGYPTVIGSFWRRSSGGVSGTTDTNSSAGTVNNGVATSGGTCVSPAANSAVGDATPQTCTSWCRGTDAAGSSGPDTLVLGISGRSSSVSGELSPTVTFNSSGTTPISLTRVVHFPNTDGTIANASGLLFSEVWYAHNPYYLYTPGSPGAVGATSYPFALRGTVGAQLSSMSVPGSSTTMTVAVSNFVNSNSKICVGDTLQRTTNPDRFASGTTVTGTPGGLACNNAAGTYTFSPATSSQAMNDVVVQASSNYLVVSGVAGSFTTGGTLTAATSPFGTYPPNAGPVANSYTILTTPTYLVSGIYTQGASSNLVSTPGGTVAPPAGMLVGVLSGNGRMAANARVAASPAPTAASFTLTQTPTTPIAGDSICGGTCAMFKDQWDAASETDFTISRLSTTQWSGGFMCMKGVDQPNIVPVTSSSSTARAWQEVVR